MSEFTKEEISLCKQVAKKHRKEINYGDWYLVKGENQVHLHNNFLRPKIAKFAKEMSQLVPLWTISDCLEFFRENYDKLDFSTVLIISESIRKFLLGLGKESINDLNITCLKAVLAVLEEK